MLAKHGVALNCEEEKNEKERSLGKVRMQSTQICRAGR